MDVGLFALTEASDLEWNTYLDTASETKIKKRLISGDIALLTERGTIEVRSELLSSATTALQLFGNLDGEYLPVTELRKRVPSMDVNFFLHMPTLLGFMMQCVEGQVEGKLWGSKQTEYEALAASQLTRGDGAIHSLITHQFYDSMALAKKDVGASLSWQSYVEAKLSGDMAPIHHRFLRFGGDFVRIQGTQLMYRAELTPARFYRDHEVSELDLRQGIVYVDVLNNAKTFYLPVDLQGVEN